MAATTDHALDVVDFWFSAGETAWFKADADFDAAIRDRFLALHEAAAAGAHDAWEATPHGALALLLLLDQFPRNMFRGTARMYATDDRALGVADRALARGFDRAYPAPAKSFFYMPFMHAENMAAQERCIDLVRTALGREAQFHALEHMDIVRRFGRFPHRNAILGRTSTEAEERYLATDGFKG